MMRDSDFASPMPAALCALMLAAALHGCAKTDGAQKYGATTLMQAQGGKLQSMHSLPFIFEAEPAYALTEVNDRTDLFNGVPYIISRAAFIGEAAAIMIHAETVADKSGASNYNDLPLADWPAPGFRSQGAVCMELSEADIQGEADPEWLLKNGFTMIGSVALAKYFLSSPDYNDEIVISLMARVPSCIEASHEEPLDALKAAFRATPL